MSPRITLQQSRVLFFTVLCAYSWEQTAHALGVTVPTVATHWRAICSKQRVPPDRDAKIWILRQLLGFEAL